MGNKCSDMDKKDSKPLDAPSSDEENEDADQEEGEEEDPEADELEEDKQQTEQTLNQGLTRGKTAVFKEAIDHAAALGLDEGAISKAEQKLEEHKAFRKREAFEQELGDFLASDESNDIAACEKMLSQGKDYGVNDRALASIQEKIADLELRKPLRPDELEQAKQFMELCTRRFVASCIKGRKAQRLDLDEGDKQDAVIALDLTLKNLTVSYSGNTESFKFADVTVSRAADVEEVTDSDAFGDLKDEQRDCAVALVPSGGTAMCILEANKAKQDEFVCGCTVLLGVGLGGSAKKKSGKDKKADSLRNAAAAEDEASPPKEEKKARKSVKETEEVEEEKPPPPPPPAEDPEEELSEAEEASEAEASEE